MISAEEARSRIDFESMDQVLKQWEDIENSVESAVEKGLSSSLMWGRLHPQNKESLEELGYQITEGIDAFAISWKEEVKENGENDRTRGKDSCNY